MNRVKSILAMLMRSSPLRGEDGRVAPRSVMVLVASLDCAWWASASRRQSEKSQKHGQDT